MNFHFGTTGQSFHFLPALVLTRQQCENPYCRAAHGWSLEFAFLFWEIALDFEP